MTTPPISSAPSTPAASSLPPPTEDPSSAKLMFDQVTKFSTDAGQLTSSSQPLGSVAYQDVENIAKDGDYQNMMFYEGNPFNLNQTAYQVNQAVSNIVATQIEPAVQSGNGVQALQNLSQQLMAIYQPEVPNTAFTDSAGGGAQFGVQTFGGASLVPGYTSSVAQAVSTDLQSAQAATSASDKSGYLQAALATMMSGLGGGTAAAGTAPPVAGTSSGGPLMGATLTPAEAQQLATALSELQAVASKTGNMDALNTLTTLAQNLNDALSDPSSSSAAGFAQQFAAGLQQVLSDLAPAMSNASVVDPATANQAYNDVGSALSSLNSTLANAGGAPAPSGAGGFRPVAHDVRQLETDLADYGPGSTQVAGDVSALEGALSARQSSAAAPAGARPFAQLFSQLITDLKSQGAGSQAVQNDLQQIESHLPVQQPGTAPVSAAS